MTFQDEMGKRIVRTFYAEEALEYNQLVKLGTAEGKLKKGTARATIVGVTVPSQLQTQDNGEGFQVAKTNYPIGSLPEVVDKGVVYVKLGSGVSGATQGMRMMSDANGFAVPYTKPTLTVGSTKDTDASTEIKTALAAIIDEPRVIAGKLVDGGDAGDLVRIDLDDRR